MLPDHPSNLSFFSLWLHAEGPNGLGGPGRWEPTVNKTWMCPAETPAAPLMRSRRLWSPPPAAACASKPSHSGAAFPRLGGSHKKGLSQSEFSELLSIQAHSIAAQELKIATYARAEVDKIGTNGPQRIEALTRWIRGEMGDADARPIIASMATAAHIKFYEKLLSKQTSQGAASFTQQYRVPPDTSGIPGFEKMSARGSAPIIET
jgi:hypothetical protein